jgi:hypothetical protein
MVDLKLREQNGQPWTMLTLAAGTTWAACLLVPSAMDNLNACSAMIFR